MTHVICRLAAKNRDQLQNPTLGNRVSATFTFFNLRTKKPFKTRKILKPKKTFTNLKPENLFKNYFFPDTVGIWCGSVTTLSIGSRLSTVKVACCIYRKTRLWLNFMRAKFPRSRSHSRLNRIVPAQIVISNNSDDVATKQRIIRRHFDGGSRSV